MILDVAPTTAVESEAWLLVVATGELACKDTASFLLNRLLSEVASATLMFVMGEVDAGSTTPPMLIWTCVPDANPPTGKAPEIVSTEVTAEYVKLAPGCAF